ncbi:glycoside hydrolase family 3 protein [Teratosphaeria destructans]|uniref:Probable beta-glucosidase G n=1 Tax=Teratosphaeria destructans TaxID=418781 RepID=A0A9W7W542_9PEZI|nr:glycoside hydrolase family 3 protein [Teratosphaeria destructans]
MGLSLVVQRTAAVLITLSMATQGRENTSRPAPGPDWNHAEFETSPPVYPSPKSTGLDWEAAFERASSFVDQLTLAEKIELVTGTPGPCVGNIAPIPRLGFDGLCLHDGPLGIRQATYASVFPAGISVAASWDRKLAKQRGVDMGTEFKGKGAHVALGPAAGPLGRSARGGRNWEGFSPDPYLTGKLFADTIEGMQSEGVQACAKHYIGNEQETQRNPSVSSDGTTIEAVSSNIDDRTMHEVYSWPFAEAVKIGTASIMCSYNRINGSYACQNSKTLNGLLKNELGFQGYVLSDWGATHSGYHAINAGLDMNLPGGLDFRLTKFSYFGKNLTMAVNNGSVPEDRLNDMVRRVLTPYFALGQNEQYPASDGSAYGLDPKDPADILYNFTLGASNVDVRGDHAELIRELGAAGIVLLKNTNSALPLKAPKNIGVFGDAQGDVADGLYYVRSGEDTGFPYGVLPVGGGAGTGRHSYVVPPLDAVKARARQQGNNALVQYVQDNRFITDANGFSTLSPSPPDVCLVFVKTWATEDFDRTGLLLDWNGTGVVETVAASCPNTIVVTNSGGLNILPFADHPNVTAILAAHYPGQEVGNSIVDVLWGSTNPSGKLPYTIAAHESDYAFSDITNSTALQKTTDPNAWQSDFQEGLLIDYRWFDHANHSVRYEFGFGLSYTTFALAHLSIAQTSPGPITARPANATVRPGGLPALWDTLYTVTARITNTGPVAGAAVPQLYLGIPSPDRAVTPVKVLRGFEKVDLQPGEGKDVAFALTRRDVSYWDVGVQQWVIGDGAVEVYAGFSSRDVQARGRFAPVAGSGNSTGGRR